MLENPRLDASRAICQPRSFRGTIINEVPFDSNRRGIQNVIVLPAPVAAVDTTTRCSRRKSNWQSSACQRHGVMPNLVRARSRISLIDGRGVVLVLVGGICCPEAAEGKIPNSFCLCRLGPNNQSASRPVAHSDTRA